MADSIEDMAEDGTVPLGSSAPAEKPVAPAAGPSTAAPDNSDVFSGLADVQRRKNAALESASSSVVGGLNRDLANVREKAARVGVEAGNLKPWNADEESAKRTTDPIAAFGSWGSVFGILASAFTRAPMENALNASAAAMGAIREGDARSYDRAYKAWEQNTKQTMDRHKIEHDAYTDATSLLNTNMAAGEAKMRVLAARFDDQKLAFLLDNGLNKEAQDLIAARQKSTLEFQQAAPKIWLENMKMSDLLNRGYSPQDPLSPKSRQALQGWEQDWNGRKFDEDAQFSEKWHAENPEGTSDEFRDAFAEYKQAITPDKSSTSKRVPKPEEAEINRRVEEKVAAGMDRSKAYEEAVREVKVAGAVPSGNRLDDLKGMQDRITTAESIIDKIDGQLLKHKAITGLGGTLTRPVEVVGNLLGSNETDRVQFARQISELKELLPRIITGSNARPLAAEVANINRIVAGLSPGDTGANTIRAYAELRPLLKQLKQNLVNRGLPNGAAPAASTSSDTKKPWERDPVVGGTGKRSDIPDESLDAVA